MTPVRPSPVIVSSREDDAGTTIASQLAGPRRWTRETTDFARDAATGAWLVTIDEPLVHATGLDDTCKEVGIEPACYIFASRHKSATGRPSLLAHVTGNWGPDNDLGGDPEQICMASGTLLKLAFIGLRERKAAAGQGIDLDEFMVGIEVTHHGPTCLRHPLVFIELGSDKTTWTNEAGAKIVAGTILDLVDSLFRAENDFDALARESGIDGVGIGFGGLHYPSTFERVMLAAPVAFSHLVPKHAIGLLTRETIERAMQRTVEPVSWFALDWKGMNKEHKDHLLPLLDTFDVPVRRTKELARR